MKLNKLLSGIALMAIASITQAAVIPVADVVASSTFFTYNSDNLINGSGLTGALHSGNYTDKWMTNGTVTGTLTFDLGAAYDVSSSTIWNYGGGCCDANRSVKDLDIEASLNGVTFFSLGSYILSQSAVNPIPSETLLLSTAARYFRFNLNSNYGATYTGLSEVQFNGTASSVPEPTSLILMSLGLLGLGFSRKKKSA